MATTSLYRSLPAERRLALVTYLLASHKEARALYAQRIVAKGGGFRAVTVQSWPAERLAREVVRLNAQTADDEMDLLQLLYVDFAPEIQTAFLDSAGVRHTNGTIDESLQAPYADAAAVVRAADVVHRQFWDDGLHYLRTIARYNLAAWPGLDDVLRAIDAAAGAIDGA
jgi:hypothetical protein